MRSKKKIIITTFIGAIMLLAGCHSVGTDQEQKDNKKTELVNPPEENKKDDYWDYIKM